MFGSRLWMAGALLTVCTSTMAEPTNFRVGIGSFMADTDPAATYMPTDKNRGFSLFAEMPQSDNTASRFIYYRLKEDNKQTIGFETQLMWGIGLSTPGFRLYTGPAWHHEKTRVARASSNHQVFNGWGWQLGTGYQYKALTLDISATLRDNHEYHAENKRAGLNTQKPTSYIGNVLISYRF